MSCAIAITRAAEDPALAVAVVEDVGWCRSPSCRARSWKAAFDDEALRVDHQRARKSWFSKPCCRRSVRVGKLRDVLQGRDGVRRRRSSRHARSSRSRRRRSCARCPSPVTLPALDLARRAEEAVAVDRGARRVGGRGALGERRARDVAARSSPAAVTGWWIGSPSASSTKRARRGGAVDVALDRSRSRSTRPEDLARRPRPAIVRHE